MYWTLAPSVWRSELQLNSLQESAVKEISNIGLGHAVTGLTNLTGKPFNMTVPDARPMNFNEIMDVLGGAENLSIGVLMPIDGDLTGHMGLLLPWDSACSLWNSLLGMKPDSIDQIDELYASGALEVGNIINSCFLNAISDMTAYALHATPPLMAADCAASILGSMMSVADEHGGVALTIRTKIYDEVDNSFEGVFLYVPNEDSLSLLFERLGIGADAA